MQPDGLWVWVWNWRNCDGGNYDAIAARIKACGAAGIIVKASDGASWFDQGVPVSIIISEMTARGVAVATWGYVYGADLSGEAQRAIETIAANPAFHVLDTEQEIEDVADPAGAATYLATTIAASNHNKTPLCYAPLPAIRYHLRLPYRQFTDADFAMLPQLYWTGLEWTVAQTVAVFYGDAAQYQLLTQPVYPAYEDAAGYEVSDADLPAFVTAVRGMGATGLSVWEYSQMSEAAWQRAATVAAALAPPQPAPDPCAEVEAELEAVQAQIVTVTAELVATQQKVANAAAALA